MEELYAEDVGHYWKTSRASPETWLEKAGKEIGRAGGVVEAEGFGREGDKAAYMLKFRLGGDGFKIVWQVLPSRGGDGRAARIQAATALYHDVKSRCVSAKWMGKRAAFLSYLELPDGRTASQASAPELLAGIPQMFGVPPQLASGIIEGEVQER
jgi:hypothetical protein